MAHLNPEIHTAPTVCLVFWKLSHATVVPGEVGLRTQLCRGGNRGTARETNRLASKGTYRAKERWGVDPRSSHSRRVWAAMGSGCLYWAPTAASVPPLKAHLLCPTGPGASGGRGLSVSCTAASTGDVKFLWLVIWGPPAPCSTVAEGSASKPRWWFQSLFS